MSFPTTPILDVFTGAGTDASFSQIIALGAFAVINLDGSGHGVSAGAPTTFAWDYWNVNTVLGSDVESYVTLFTASTTDSTVVRVGGRVTNFGTSNHSGYYVAVSNAGAWTLIRITNGGAPVTLATLAGTQVLGDGDAVGCEIIGSIITGYYKASGGSWASRGSYDTVGDATKYSGAGAIAIEFRTSVVDDFGGGTVVPPLAQVGQFPTHHLGRGAGW